MVNAKFVIYHSPFFHYPLFIIQDSTFVIHHSSFITIAQNVSPKGKNTKVFDGFTSRG